MKIMVTGGAGFVGRFVVRHLESEGHNVVSVDIVPSDRGTTADLTDRRQTYEVLSRERPEVVIHMAALAGATGKGGGVEGLKRPYDYLSVNINGATNVFEACRELGISHVICMSSFSPYGRARCPISEETPLGPNNPYGASKLCVEEIAKCYAVAYGVKTVIFRPPLICGEGQKEMNALREFVTQAVQGAPIVIFGEGKHVREFVHPADIAKALYAGVDYVYKMVPPYDVIVLGSKPISMRELAELVIRKVGRGSIEYKPATSQAFDQFTDHSKAASVLSWEPEVEIDEIVTRVIEDIKPPVPSP